MTKYKIIGTCVVFWMITLIHAHAQKVVTQQGVFETTGQSMWGPSAAAGLNRTITIFPRYAVRKDFNTGNSAKFTVNGLDFGVVLDGHIAFGVGPFELDISGFSTGEVDVLYPVEVSVEVPNDDSFNRGETIVIKSSFLQKDTETDSAKLITRYPKAGTIGLYLGIMFDASFGMQACFIKCSPHFYIIPDNDPTTALLDSKFTFFEVSEEGLTYICDNTSDPLDFLSSPFQCEFNTGFPPWTVNAGAFSGTMKIPNVETVSTLNGNDLEATGRDPYVIPSINVVELLGYIPPIKPVTSIIQGSKTIDILPDVTGTMRGITLEWALLNLLLNTPIAQSQAFHFKPTVYTTLTFPETVNYVVHSRLEGNKPGKGTTIEYAAGDSVSVEFPCHYDFMDITATHSLRNEFSNKTFDNISLELEFNALDFGITLDKYVIIPEVCIPLPLADPICIGPVEVPETSFDPYPLINPDPITLVSKDFPPYFNKSWELGGFNTIESDPIRLKARPATIDFTSKDLQCNQDKSGEIDVTVTGATEPLAYAWSFGDATASPRNVDAGKHYVKITDANNCTSFARIELTQPDAIEINLTSGTILCAGGMTDIVSEAHGGTGVLQYQWNSGEVTSSIQGIHAGTYTVTVEDENNCKQSATAVVTEPPPLQVEAVNPVHPSCFGSNDGAIDTFVQGGTAPYTYTWSTNSHQPQLSEISEGTYMVTVTDQYGCSGISSAVLQAPPSLTLQLVQTSSITCFGEGSGAIQATAGGGTAPYTYHWSNEQTVLAYSGSLLDELKAGDYSLEIVDANHCRTSGSINLQQPASPLQVNLDPTPGKCAGDGMGSIVTTVAGGTPPYMYLWSNGEQTPLLTGVPSGKYQLVVSDANNCNYETQTMLVEPVALTANLYGMDVSCNDQQDGFIKITKVFGGTPPYAYMWNTGSNEALIKNLPAGDYHVIIRDANNCETTEAYTIGKLEGDCMNIPNTFSPNGDGINDTWIIPNIELYDNAHVTIVNKWGTRVFESTGYNSPWDGTYKGRSLEPTTYYYTIDLRNGTPVYTGYLIIVR